MSKTVEQYVQHIESICGCEGRYFRISDPNEVPPISVISFEGVPEVGCSTAFSYGLSSVNHEEWRYSRPELVISVNSLNTAWALAMGELIRNGRDRCLFSYGNMLKFGQRITNESDMTAFLVFACTILNENDLSVDLPDRKILFSQIYPVYEEELALISDVGPERFVFDLGIDLFDVSREPFGKCPDAGMKKVP
jgi:hypothetical protein